ncbi:metal ABC transporter substrate-binding protein [Marisediminicola antarctica]|uniref:Iron-binding protein n=1 Tax=Marisediminicola antarctica TaxID=674079 RepID=A0A7L5AG56_9MICO|nr:metal ABC transporter substrate-binding protein [Marisediminicola antarctica]QHO69490.1 iron-binding protein [Marisediminicola antarctica]
MPKTRVAVYRKVAAAATLIATALALVGCAPAASPRSGKPLVLTTFTVIADMAQVVGGDAVEVESITKVGAEIHGYEPTPSDLAKASSARLILDNGFGLERWFEDFLARSEAPHAVLTEGVEPIDIRSGDYAGLPNPHAWMSPIAGQVYVDNIRDALTELVPTEAEQFAANAEAYKAELQVLADELAAVVAELPERQRLLISCEGAFSYLARDIGLAEGYLWPVNSDTQGTPQQIKAAIELVRESGVGVVFCETTVSADAQRQVAREAGAEYGGTLYVDSLSEPDGPVPSYLELLRYDVDLIAEGLSGG